MARAVALAVAMAMLGACACDGTARPGVTRTPDDAPSSAFCVARDWPALLDKQRFGDAIQDGVGYGGVRVGDPLTELVRRWGAEGCSISASELTYGYLTGEDELVGVRVKQGRVFMLVFGLPPHGGRHGVRRVPPSLTTSLGIELLGTLAEVRRAYGAPDVETRRTAIHTRRGIGFLGPFDKLDPRVLGVVVFAPGTPPAELDLEID
jgi:hypothetical protein